MLFLPVVSYYNTLARPVWHLFLVDLERRARKHEHVPLKGVIIRKQISISNPMASKHLSAI